MVTEPTGRPLSRADLHELWRRYGYGEPIAELAEEYHLPPTMVREFLHVDMEDGEDLAAELEAEGRWRSPAPWR